MKKLENIGKRQIFNVPEGYFDKLPLKISERVGKPERQVTTGYRFVSLRYALPVLLIAAAGIFWYVQTNTKTIEQQLMNIDENELMAFITEDDFYSEDLTEAFQLDADEVDELEKRVINTFETSEHAIEDLLDEYTLESENF